jgi:hypothetical protein
MLIQMDLGNITKVLEVSQNAQKQPRMLRMALTDRKGKKFKVPKTQLKWLDREECVTIFPTTQTTHQTELQIKRYKKSKFWST